MEINSLQSLQQAIKTNTAEKIDIGELRELCHIIRDQAIYLKSLQLSVMNEKELQALQVQYRLEQLYEQLTGLEVDKILKV
jgi:hypothetical protein